MMQAEQGRASALGPGLILAGAVVTAIGCVLDWVKVSALGQTQSASGLDTDDGKIFLGVGIALFVIGAVLFAGKSKGLRTGLGVLALLGGLFVAGFATRDVVTAEDSFADAVAEEVASSSGVPIDQARAAVDQALAAEQISLSAQFGLYITIVGGVLAAIGGLLAVTSAKALRVGAAAPPPPVTAGTTEWAAPAPPATPAPPPPPPPAAPEPPAG